VYIFETTDPLGRTIRLRQDTWEQHIIIDRGRNDFTGHVEVVKHTVEQPHYIVPSTRLDSIVYFRLGGLPRYPNLYVKVPVRIYGDNTGEVRTALLQRDIRRGTDSTRGIPYVNWPSS
jgi:hypothetical protein